MESHLKDNTAASDQKNGFDIFFEILGWLQIVASPLLWGSLLAVLLYFYWKSPAAIVIGILLIIAGLLTGIVWANRKWRKGGTIRFVSEIDRTPELDKPDEK